MDLILKGEVLWSTLQEVQAADTMDLLASQFSGVNPFNRHRGQIVLTPTGMIIRGDTNVDISLSELTQLSVGYDDVFHRGLTKNFGITWQPLRVCMRDGSVYYMIIDYRLGFCRNQLWYDTLKQMYS
jgi:hypothetical protein